MAKKEILLTASEVAVMLQCSKAHISRLCTGKAKGHIPLPFIRVGRRVAFRKATLKEWMEECEAASTRKKIPQVEI